MDISKTHKYLFDKFPGERIYNRYRNFLIQIQCILENLGIIDKVRIDTRLLELAVLDYFADIERLKDFQGIERVSVSKIYSYGTYWFLRRKPIQIIVDSLQKEFLYINEKVCILLIFPKMLVEMDINTTGESKRIEAFFGLLYYNLKYRTYTQKSLELMLEAFFCGCSCFSLRKTVDND